MSDVKTYRDLQAWQRAMALAEEVYRLTGGFPGDERFGLTAQLRRAAISIASNIAEGHARVSRLEFRHQVSIARGSLAEVETQLILALRLGYLDRDAAVAVWALARDVGRLINGLLRALPAKRTTSQSLRQTDQP